MRATLEKIGNDCCVRFPKEIMEQARLGTELDLDVIDGVVVIRTAHATRSGWSQAAIECNGLGDDCLGAWDSVIADQWDSSP